MTVLAVAAAACAGESAETTTTAAPGQPTTPSSGEPSTAASSPPSTTTQAGPEVLAENVQTALSAGVRYRLVVNGVTIHVTPPLDNWELLYYVQTGSEAGALFGWRGPSGFRAETLNVLIREVAGNGVDAAWPRVEAVGEAGLASAGEPWTLEGEGISLVGGVRADWREYRTPPLRTEPELFAADIHFTYSLRGAGGAARLLLDTSARFFVVPLSDLTVTIVGYETRCACVPNPTDAYDRGGQIGDDTENELSMWIPELEAFLASLEFVDS
jgi:hypothetical protein